MTETDKIYGALIGDMKKYGVEHSISTLEYYITKEDCLGFTSDNGARALISQISAPQVMAETLRGILKYQIIVEKRNLQTIGTNTKEIMKAFTEYNNNQKITANLKPQDIEEIVKIMLDNNDIAGLLDLFSNNHKIFQDYLVLYSTLLCNYRNDMNKIDNANFPEINEYFAKYDLEEERQK